MISKKRCFALILAAIFLLSLCSCTSHEKDDLPEITIGYENYRPYIRTDEDGNPSGLDVDLAVEACRRMGYKAVFREIDWDNRDKILESGSVDCLWSCLAMDVHDDSYSWAGPYMMSRQVVAVPYDSPIRTVSDLEGKEIAVREGSKAESIFLGYAGIDVPSVQRVYCLDKTEDAVTALRNEYVDACAGYAASLREQLELADIEYRFLDDDLSYAKIGVAFSKDSKSELREKLEKAFEEMYKDGTTERILKRYGVDTEKALKGVTGDEN